MALLDLPVVFLQPSDMEVENARVTQQLIPNRVTGDVLNIGAMVNPPPPAPEPPPEPPPPPPPQYRWGM